jgi:hypothetical protein
LGRSVQGCQDLFWEFLQGGNFARTATSQGSQWEVLEDISSKCLARCLIEYGRFKPKSPLDQKMAGEVSHRLKPSFTKKQGGHMFAPKFGTKPIRLAPLVRPMPLDGLTGEESCRHTVLTGGLDRSDRWTTSPSRIVESLRISSCKRIPCGARPSHPINIKGHIRLRWHHPIDHYFFTTFISQTLDYPTSCFPCLSRQRSGMFRPTLGAPPLTGSLSRR